MLLSWLHGALLTTGILDKTKLRMRLPARGRPVLQRTLERVCKTGNEEPVLLSSSRILLADLLFAHAPWLQGPACLDQTELSEI